MVNFASNRVRGALRALALLFAGMAVLIAANARAVELPTADEAFGTPADGPPQREIFIPFDDLHVILSGDVQRVFVTREEYDALLAKAKKAARPDEPVQPAAVLSADYVATIEENRARLMGTLVVTAPGDDLSAVDLDLSGVALRSATLDDKPAALGRNPAGMPVLFVSGAGRHELKLEILAPLETAAAQRTLSFQIPTPPATRIKLTVPGNVEIKSGATIINRDVDSRPATTFDLLPRRGRNSLVLSLNNHQLRKETVAVAHAVLIDEITSAYERLYATESMSVLHGAAEQFRFALPDGFEVTSVAGPQVARWSITTENGQRILDVRLREPITDTASLNIAAIRTPVALANWRLPKLSALDVAGQVAVVGLLLENRLKPSDLQPKNLISIDAGALTASMPAGSLDGQAGAPELTTVAAFYAPRGDYDLSAGFAPPPTELRVTTNVLLTLTESKLEARGGFALLNVTDKLLDFDFSAPADWQVTELTLDGGTIVTPEMYPAANGGTRVHVRLPQAVPLGRSRNVYFRAVSTPKGWLDEWNGKPVSVEFPVFQVAGATRDGGAIAVQSQDDMLARADKVTRLTPLDANEKSKFGLENMTTELAYRYEEPPYGLTLAVSRVEPRITARVFSFFRVEPDLLTAHYEIAYNVTEARTARLLFALPANTPAELSIHALDNLAIKESSSVVKDKQRQWTVLLGESRRGAIRLAVDFQQPLSVAGGGEHAKQTPPKEPSPAKKNEEAAVVPPANVTLPLVRALHVAYQTGMISVEGSSESDVQVVTTLRKVDVGRLAEADYQPGRRLLGAFGYGGDDAEVKVAVARPAGYELPSAIVERAELLTMISASGRSQTAARFQLRSKALLIEVQLPAGSQLWSAFLDGKPTQPQREADSLLVEMPAMAEARRRDLQLVYETPIYRLGMASSFELAAPKLLLRTRRNAAGDEVPLADLVWRLSTPSGLKVVRSIGTVFSGQIAERESPVARVSGALGDIVEFDSGREAAKRAPRFASVDSSMSMKENVKSVAPAAARPAQTEQINSDEEFKAADKSTEDLNTETKMDMSGRDEAPSSQFAPTKAPPPVDVHGAPPRRTQEARARQSLWALEGVRSLPIEFEPESDQIQTTFQSLGEEPRLNVTLVDRQRFELLGWAIGLLVFLRGMLLTMQPRWRRIRFVGVTLVVSFALPLLVPWTGVISPLCNMAFYAACWLVVYYLAAGVVKRIVRFSRGARKQTAMKPVAVAAVALLLLLARSATAEEPPAPVKVPADAIIVPYDPAKQDPMQAMREGKAFGADKSQKILVPYDKYIELQRAAHPGEKAKTAPPADYSLSGGQFLATLGSSTQAEGGESLVVEGHLDVDVLVDRAVSIPLALGDGVLTKIEVDGKPGQAIIKDLEALNNPFGGKRQVGRAPAADAKLALIVSGPGRRHVALEMRFPIQRRGGWQIAEGRLPTSPAAAITLHVAKAGTEVALSGGVDHGNFETKHDNESIETALAPDGAFRVQWRAKAEAAPVDQSLAAHDSARLDVQEDGLRLVWQFDLAFRRAQRDSFVIDVPDGYLVEKVTGLNVRGWNLTEAGGLRKLEVTLLKAAQGSETFGVSLSRRGAVGSAGLTEFAAPVLSVEGAAQQSGELTIRSSPLLELRVESTAGASRADTDAPRAAANADADESPLGIVPFQVYRFATTPFTVKLSARPVTPHVSAEFQTVLRISERQRTLESRIRMRVEGRAIYRLRIALPDDFRTDRIEAPEPFQWIVGQEGQRRLLSLYFAAGQRKPFDIVLSGSLGKYGAAETVAVPKLEIIDADNDKATVEQTGDIAVEVDPSLDVRAEKLVHCDTESTERVGAWLNPVQQRLARLALRYRTPDYSAQLQLSPRKPLVRCDSYTNIRVNERTVEETILLDFTIRDAGIRSLSFVLPESMRGARISAPMLRQKTIEAVEPAAAKAAAGDATPRVRVRIELQEEVMGSLRVLVENDRLLSSDKYTVPEPVVETGQTDHRYITLESAGRDEVVVDTREGIDAISQEQAEWRMLTAMLGRGLTQAYLVQPGASRPQLTLHAQDRATVETASARIGLAKAVLVVDANGAYRGAQLYRVDNSLEQFLEVQLPAGARLWTAHVAGEPVKPAAGGAAAAADAVRIPLIKTAHGDADYAVVLKYGGQLGRLAALDHLAFPLIHTVNIHVELSQVELYLPESYDWFNFGGTMRLVHSEGDLTAGWLSYNTRQIDLAKQALHSEDPFARTRAAHNLKALQEESESLKQSAEGYRGNSEVAQQLQANTSIQTGLNMGEPAQADKGKNGDEGQTDNRARFGSLYKSQANSRANDVVNSSGENFSLQAQAQPRPQSDDAAKGRGQNPGAGTSLNADVGANPFGEPAAGHEALGVWDTLQSRQNGSATTAAALNPPAGKDEFGATSGKAPEPNITWRTRAAEEAPNARGAADQPVFTERGGGVTSSSVQRYADRLAQQEDQGASNQAADSDSGSVFDWDKNTWTRKPNRGTDDKSGPIVVSGSMTKSGSGTISGTGTLTLSGAATYTGATVVNGGTLQTPAPQAYSQNGGDFAGANAGSSLPFVNVPSRPETLAPAPAARPAPAALVSLDLELHPTGVKYLFTTPRGEAEVTARAVSDSLVDRLVRLTGLAVAILLLWALVARLRRWQATRSIPSIPAAR